VDAWYYAHGYDVETSLAVPFHMNRDRYSIFDPASVDRLLEELQAIHPVLVVYDTLGACSSGSRAFDENSNSDAHVVTQQMCRIRDQFDSSVTLIHHEGRLSQPGQARRPNRAPRGASAYEGNLDVLIHVTARHRRPAGNGGTLTWTNRRMKDAPRFEPITLSANRYDDSLVVVDGPTGPKAPRIRRADLLNALRNQPGHTASLGTLAGLLGVKTKTVHTALGRLMPDLVRKLEKDCYALTAKGAGWRTVASTF
jgi:hypothetical protein